MTADGALPPLEIGTSRPGEMREIAGASVAHTHAAATMGAMVDRRGMRKQYHFWPSESGDDLDAWDVDHLIELAQALPPERIGLDAIAEIDSVYWFDDVHRPTVRSVAKHARLIDEVDLRYPVILGPDGRVMDGMHRIARAMKDGHRHVSAVRFTELPPADHRNVRPEDLTYERD